MSWQVLIVHSKEPAALSAKLQLMAEFEDVAVRTVASPSEGLALAAREAFDLVLCELDPADPAWREFKERVGGPSGPRPPLVMLPTSPAEDLEAQLAAEGCHCLPSPFSPRQLR
jgi:CheY-like chemotaxis protein